MNLEMTKLVARIILATIIGVVIVMTYLAMRGNDVNASEYNDWLQSKSRDSLPSFQNFQHRKKPKPIRGPPDNGIIRPPIEKIKVAYPVENVPGLQDVAQGDDDDGNYGNPGNHGNNNVSSANNLTDTVQIMIDKQADGRGVFQMPRMEGENIISMTLYGSSRRYTMGALRNAELIKTNFPGWKLRIYTETPSTSKFGIIPKEVVESLRALGADFYFMQPGEDFIPPMMWRFLVADDIWVDYFIVRDADARLTQRDAAAVYAWTLTNKPFTCIRDHPSHASYAISGGMWGGKPRELRNVLRRSWKDLMRGVPSHYLEDMNFLDKVIWPKVQSHAYCLDSVSCQQWQGAHPFPVPRYGYEHVGQVVNEHDLGRPVDLQILRNAGENKNCTPVTDNHSNGVVNTENL